jgi:hypothetical protein
MVKFSGSFLFPSFLPSSCSSVFLPYSRSVFFISFFLVSIEMSPLLSFRQRTTVGTTSVKIKIKWTVSSMPPIRASGMVFKDGDGFTFAFYESD